MVIQGALPEGKIYSTFEQPEPAYVVDTAEVRDRAQLHQVKHTSEVLDSPQLHQVGGHLLHE
jgi:hypothetical protein